MSRFKNLYETQIENAIDTYGRNVTVVYGTTVNCSSCGYDPVNKESTNYACSTCNGKFFYETENNLSVKGALKTFLGNMGFQDYSLNKFGFVPEFDARVTFWLPDVLVDSDSATGATYLDEDKNIRIEVDTKKYKIHGIFKTGIETLKVVISTLKEIK
jgi:hypothetical protein